MSKPPIQSKNIDQPSSSSSSSISSIATERFIKKDWQKELDIPQGWNKIDVKKQDGVKYRALENPTHNEIRVMKSRSDSQWPSQHVDYVKIMRNGHYRDIIRSSHPFVTV